MKKITTSIRFFMGKQLAFLPLILFFVFTAGCKPDKSTPTPGNSGGSSSNPTVTTFVDSADPNVNMVLTFDAALQITSDEINRVRLLLGSLPANHLSKIKHIDFHPVPAGGNPTYQATADGIVLNIGSGKDGGSFPVENMLPLGIGQHVFTDVLTADERQQWDNIASQIPPTGGLTPLSPADYFANAYESWILDSDQAMVSATDHAMFNGQPYVLEETLFIASLFGSTYNDTLIFYKERLNPYTSTNSVPFTLSNSTLTIGLFGLYKFDIQNNNIVEIDRGTQEHVVLSHPVPIPPIVFSRLSQTSSSSSNVKTSPSVASHEDITGTPLGQGVKTITSPFSPTYYVPADGPAQKAERAMVTKDKGDASLLTVEDQLRTHGDFQIIPSGSNK